MNTKADTGGIIQSLFTGTIRNDLLFPCPGISEEELQNLTILHDNLEEFCGENIDNERISREDTIPHELFQGMADIGFFGLEIPEEYGGYGFSLYSYLKAVEIVATHSASVAAAVGSLCSLGMKSILYFGDEHQKQQYLGHIASGEKLIAFALTEDSAGSDVNAIITRASLSEDGDCFIIEGVKKFVANAAEATYAIVLAKTEVDIRGRLRERISAFIVPLSGEGISLTRKWHKMGMQGLDVYEVSFNKVRIPRANMLGQPGQGFNIAMTVLNEGRLAQAAGALGIMKRIYRLAIDETKRRRQFGKQLLDFDMVQDRIARMLIGIYAAESMIFLTAGCACRAGLDFSAETAACKIYATDHLWWVANTALQLSGGMGYIQGNIIEQTVRDARMHQIVNGTNEVLSLFIALSGLKFPEMMLRGYSDAFANPLKNPVSALRSLYSLASQQLGRIIPAEFIPGMSGRMLSRFIVSMDHFSVDEDLRTLSDELEVSISLFARKLEAIILKNGPAFQERELQCERIGRSAVALFACTASLARLHSLLNLKGKAETSAERNIVTLLIHETSAFVERTLAGLDDNQDTILQEIATNSSQHARYHLGLSKYNFVS